MACKRSITGLGFLVIEAEIVHVRLSADTFLMHARDGMCVPCPRLLHGMLGHAATAGVYTCASITFE